ncbi:tetratricopeptide repeat protein [Arthrobacter sp. CJ23]|uniref:J domain-containing protein n=1 Tax=Arthrobacter sp. CJ23 TaxID=2972479 RepID=UPI00215BA50C|nr:tetratricopeptide repeat protein [Arthrobacter sp. CJ23]UVJ38042.1 tetratricopeptide repeat protein [Arthrobacter sp. CJ23]
MTFVDYYQVLELERSADSEAIRRAVQKQRTEWRRKANHPKAETRAIAEQYTQHVSDAERILLDPEQREGYNRQLVAHVNQPPVAQDSPNGGRDWLKVAREHLASGSASQANYAAREATSATPDNAEAWYLRGVTSGVLDNVADAEFELGEAIRLNSNEASYHCELGDLYMASGIPERAQTAYQRASDLDPSNLFFNVGVGSALVAQEKAAEAIPLLRKATESDPDNDLFKFHYAIALLDSTTDQWSSYADGSSSILNEAQLDLTRKNLQMVEGLRVKDPELKAHIDEVSLVCAKAERKSWYGSNNALIYAAVFGASFFGMFGAFSMAGATRGGSVMWGLLFLVIAGLLPVLFVKRHFMPGWKWEAKRSPEFVRRSGLQPSGA